MPVDICGYQRFFEFLFCTDLLRLGITPVVNTRWFKYDRDKLWLVYTQIVPVIFEPPCIHTNWLSYWGQDNPTAAFTSVTSTSRRVAVWQACFIPTQPLVHLWAQGLSLRGPLKDFTVKFRVVLNGCVLAWISHEAKITENMYIHHRTGVFTVITIMLQPQRR